MLTARRGIRFLLAAVMAASMACVLVGFGASPDPLAAFAPEGFLDAKRQADLSAGAAVVDVLPAREGDVAVFGAAKIRVSSGRLAAWIRQIEDLQRGSYVPVAGRFSDPPRLEDLDRLVLDKDDLEDIRDCEAGDCGVKLSGDEIERLRRRIAFAGEQWEPAVQAEFRWIMLRRATAYLARGNAGMPAYEDRDSPVSAATEFETVAARMNDVMPSDPSVVDYLRRFPDDRREDVESFLYWSKEELGGGKPIITITHVSMIPIPRETQTEMVVASKQVFATHYLSASLSLTSVTTPSRSGDRYLVYTRRSHVDLLQGFWGGLTRRILESRIRADGPAVLDVIRRRLESGEPPARRSPDT
jgi:hypothetical protein